MTKPDDAAIVKPNPDETAAKRKRIKRAAGPQENPGLKNNQDFSSGHGGRRPGAGRLIGVPNKVTQELRMLAQVYTTDALKTLDEICKSGESESARVAAATAILDRAFGKPKQQVESAVTGKDGGAIEFREKPSDRLDLARWVADLLLTANETKQGKADDDEEGGNSHERA